jgi:CelD/BcsL family acetyltransferase involved in cellulose biosynthesis
MRIEELTSDRALERLRPEWSSLWWRTVGAGPFQHPDWLLPWRMHLGGGDLLVLAVRDDRELIALAPFYIHVDGSGERQLTLLGNGVSDCCDVLLDRSRTDAEAGLAEALRANRAGWTSCDLRDLPPGSVLLSLLSEEWSSSISVDTPTVVLDLEWWAERQSSLPSKMMADLHRRRRRAEEKIGPVRMDWAVHGATEQAMDQLFALHGARWRARGEEGVLHGATLESFYRDIAARFSHLGWLRLSTLSVGDHLAGACLGFQLRGRAYHYIAGFDPEFAGFAIGQLMLHQIITRAARDGAYEFDFLRGEEDYKRRWGGTPRPQYRIRARWNQSRDVARAGTG